MSYIAYTSAPLDFTSVVSFDAGGPTTVVGATIRADAINTKTGAKFAGSATVVDATHIRSVFDAGSLPVGVYEIQIKVTIGGAEQVLEKPSLWTVRPGAAP